MRRFSLVLVLSAASLAAWSQSGPAAERDAFLNTEDRYLAGDWERAAERGAAFLVAWPSSPYADDARLFRAVSLYRSGRAEAAEALLADLETRPGGARLRPYAAYWRGVLDFDRGAWASAASRFEPLAASSPDAATRAGVLSRLGRAYAELGRDADARKTLETLTAPPADPAADGAAFLCLARVYARDGDGAALAALWERPRKAVLEDAVRESAALLAADAYAGLGRPEAASALYGALAASPRRDTALAALAKVYDDAKRSGDETALASALVRAESSLRGEPEQLSLFWRRIGADAFEEGKYDLARSYFLRARAALGPSADQGELVLYLADIAYKSGNAAGARSLLTESLSKAGALEGAYRLRLSWYALQAGQWKESSDLLAPLSGEAGLAGASAGERALASSYLAYALYRQDSYAEALNALAGAGSEELRAELLRRSGDAAGALESLDAAVATDAAGLKPELRAARVALFFEKGRYDRASAAAGDFLAAYPDDSRIPPALRAAVAYLGGVSAAGRGDFALALSRLDAARAAGFERLGAAASWASYYRAWSLYRLARFAEARTAFDAFAAANPAHPRAYAAAYLSAWCSASLSDYRAAAASARRSADAAARSQGLSPGDDAGEAQARSRCLEGDFLAAAGDVDGACSAYDKAAAMRAKTGAPTSSAPKALLSKASALDYAKRADAADQAYAAVGTAFPASPQAADALYRRGALALRSGKSADAAARFAAYRDAYKDGPSIEGAFYFGASALASSGKADAAILLWERLASAKTASRYRFPTLLALAGAYRDQADWDGALRAYASVLAEYGDQARAAGADDEAEAVRLRMTGMPEKPARLQARLRKEGGASSPAGRATALELSRYYVKESTQKEAGLSLLDEVIAQKSADPAAAAEASFLKGDYYASASVEAYERAALAYLDAVGFAAAAKADAKSQLRSDLAPEALFRAISARLKTGGAAGGQDAYAVLSKNYPTSPWTAQAKRLLEAAK